MAPLQAMTLRAKKLGILLQDARIASGKNKTECAGVLDISPVVYSKYEVGDASPSLPELEVLAYHFDVPIDHFWGQTAISESPEFKDRPIKMDKVLNIRRRIVGILIKQARLDRDLTLDDLSDQSGIPAENLEAYEMAEKAIPLPELEFLADLLGRSMQEFYDNKGPVGDWMRDERSTQQFLELPPDLQEFLIKPINRPYLDLAVRLSEMNVEKLRGVAEGLLEITL